MRQARNILCLSRSPFAVPHAVPDEPRIAEVRSISRRQLLPLLILAGGLLMGAAAPVAAQSQVPAASAPQKSLCADCHLISSTPRSRAHLLDWQGSVHAARGVTCDA